MALAFWNLEDGRGFAKRWSWMAYLLKLITDELKEIKGAEDFYEYLEELVYRAEKGDSPNGYGGFIRGDENIMYNIDLRTFTPQNREYFWIATQKALVKLKRFQDDEHEDTIKLLTELMRQHKSIKRRESPIKLGYGIDPESNEKLGPGW